MNKLKISILWLVVFLSLTIAAIYSAYTNPMFKTNVYEVRLIDKWIGYEGKQDRPVNRGRFEGIYDGRPFKYDTYIGNYTYQHVPYGTRHTIELRPYDIERNPWTLIKQVLMSIVSLFCFALSIIWVVTICNQFYPKED